MPLVPHRESAVAGQLSRVFKILQGHLGTYVYIYWKAAKELAHEEVAGFAYWGSNDRRVSINSEGQQ